MNAEGVIMQYNSKIMLRKLEKYFNGELEKEELGIWAERAYYDVLKGGYLEIQKVVLYPFLKTLSRFHIQADDVRDQYPSDVEDVKFIRDVLGGSMIYSFAIDMAIPKQVYTWDIADKENYICKREALDNLLSRDIRLDSIAIENVCHRKHGKGTVQGVLENDIHMMHKALFGMKDGLGEKQYLKLYSCRNNKVAENVLLKYIQCYVGRRTFTLFIEYQSGKPIIKIVV